MYFMIFSNIIGWPFIFVCSFTYGGENTCYTRLSIYHIGIRFSPCSIDGSKRDTDSTCRKGFLGEFGHLIELSVQITGWC